jgi:hypothetical protein
MLARSFISIEIYDQKLICFSNAKGSCELLAQVHQPPLSVRQASSCVDAALALPRQASIYMLHNVMPPLTQIKMIR